MTKEELVEFLKENLRINVEENNDSYDFSLFLGEEEISTAYLFLKE